MRKYSFYAFECGNEQIPISVPDKILVFNPQPKISLCELCVFSL
jgi:hypothetical protein